MNVRVETKHGGTSFALMSDRMIQVGIKSGRILKSDLIPYCVTRKEVRRVIRLGFKTFIGKMGKETDEYTFKITKETITFGCCHFIGESAEAIKKWARGTG